MIPATLHPFEQERLEALRSLKLLDTAPEEAFDALTRCAADGADAPIALVSLVDEDRQWFKSKVGLDACETPRKYAFCAHAILNDTTLVVDDSEADPRFCDNPLVVNAPFVKAYAGAPIKDRDGAPLGTLCVIDNAPRTWSRAQISQLENLAHAVSAVIALRQDRNDVAQDAAALATSLEEMQALVDEIGALSGVGGWSLNLENSTVAWSDETRKIHDVDDDYVPNLETALNFYEPEAREEVSAVIDNALKTGTGWDFTLPIRTAKGQKIWVRAVGRTILENGRARKVVGSFQDVTLQTARELELQSARDAAQQASTAKTAFLANMSHEIRTPLNGVLALIDVLRKGHLSDEQRQILGIMKSSGDTLIRILTDFLDVSKAEAGKMDLIEQEFDLERIIHAAAYTHSGAAANKDILFSTQVDDAAKGCWRGDPVRISQIVSNLVSNAVKFTKAGSVCVNASAHDGDKGEPQIVIRISDTGIGFDEATAERIFEKFEQADETITREFGGTGLGLAICRSLARRMGGDVTATSTPGAGSVFTVVIPLAKVSQQDCAAAGLPCMPAEEEADCASAEPSAFPRRLTILLAEDHIVNQQVTQFALSDIPHTLTIVADGEHAIEAARKTAFDVILMDMEMPNTDGIAATRAIRARERKTGAPAVPILMLSAHAHDEHRKRAQAAGCDGYIVKPAAPAKLQEHIKRVLGAPPLAQTA
ncbi:MAG: ATP-binding protein [Pseudomonadota bacterium]